MKNFEGMKHIFYLLIVVMITASCNTTKEAQEDEGPQLSSEVTPTKPQTMQAIRGEMTGEQIAAQLGLEGQQEEEFVEMFDATTAAMKQVRKDHKGDRQALMDGMKAVKAQRVEAVERILNDDQLTQYYILMQANRGKVRGTLQRRKG